MEIDNKLINLAVDSYFGRLGKEYSVADSQKVLREALIEANGGKTTVDLKAMRDGKCNGLFSIIEVAIEKISEEGLKGDEFFTQFIEDRNLSLGDTNIFHTKKDVLLTVADVAEGTQGIRRQRFESGQDITINTQLRAIKVYEELNRMLAGRVDFNTLVDRLTRSYTRDMRNQILAAFEGVTATTTGLNATYVKTGTFSAPTLRELIDHVEASTGEKATILGTKAGLGKIVDSDANAVALTAASAKEDLYNLGYFGKFYATPMVSMRQVHKPGTDAFAINDNKIYVMAGNDKPIKFVREGEGLMVATDAFSNADLTQEYLYGEKYGIGVIFNQKMGIYTLA